jgi:peptidyl-prolyl cis-trans isomerase C
VADAAFSLGKVGELSGVVEDDKGFHLLKLAARQAAVEQPFEAVRARLESRLLAERRTRTLDTFITEARSKVHVEVKEDVLGKLDARTPSPGGDGAKATAAP